MKKEHFSLRKYKLGLVSVMLGMAMFSVAGPVFAEERQASSQEMAVGSGLVIENHELEKEMSTSVEDLASQADENEVATSPSLAISEQNSPEEAASGSVVSSPVTARETEDSAVAPVILTDTEESGSSPVASTDTGESTPSPLVLPESKEAVPASEAPVLADLTTQAQPAQPLSDSSNQLIHVPAVWKAGYKGEGMVVAVIDSGLDVEHDVLHLTDASVAKYPNQASFETVKESAGINYGKWYSDKVIFAHNYMDSNSQIKEAEEGSHGMHVSGIAVGNPTKLDSSGEYIYGVAPEAQLIFMRVFSDTNPGTTASIYVRAIEDAVKLGADSINLSLGGANGSLINVGSALDEAIIRAKKAGVIVVIAAGNDGAFGSGHAAPLAENPDYGLVANPSTAAGSISVASYNNSMITSEMLSVISSEGSSAKKIPVIVSESMEEFEVGKSYDYVYAGLGKEAELNSINLTGKIALIKRGEITFTDKIKNAKAKGAIGVVIFNNQEGANISMSLDAVAKEIPSAFISLEAGEELAKGNYQLQFNKQMGMIPNPNAEKLSDFSSWGLSADGELKPDIAAPGGAIYSAINNGKYESKNGTSMATPHVAGVAVLLKQHLISKFPTKTPEELERLIKHLMMSTATPHFNEESKAYTSPRQQGAGLVNTYAAMTKDVYVTGKNDYASISLGNVDSKFRLSLLLHNISDQAKTLTYVTELTTDTVVDGRITLAPRFLDQIKGQTVTVQANSSTEITIDVDASRFHEDLLKEMPNGYYLEGFVRFLDADNQEVVSIPYVGFKGEWQNLPILEKSIYDLLKENQNGFYFERTEEGAALGNSDATALVTDASEYVHSRNARSDRDIMILGSQLGLKGSTLLQLDKTGNIRLAFSPNGDDNQDLIALQGVFLRNYRNLVASVYAADDTSLSNPLWQSKGVEGDKNYYSGDERNPKSTIVSETVWTGVDQNGADLPDGDYQYVVRYFPMVPGAKEQMIQFNVRLDRQSPEITTGIYNESTRTFLPRPVIEKGGSGIRSEQVFYISKDAKGKGYTTGKLKRSGKQVYFDNKVFVDRNEDGSYTLPSQIDLKDFYYAVEDHAGNREEVSLVEIISQDNQSGRLRIALKDAEQLTPISSKYSYIIRDMNGNVVETTLTPSGAISLPFGEYRVELLAYDKDNLKLVSQPIASVQIGEDNSYQSLDFLARPLTWSPIDVRFNQAIPDTATVSLIDADGRVFVLPLAKYIANGYGKDLPTGKYTFHVNLPEGIDILEDPKEVEVLENQNNHLALTISDKRELLALIAQLKSLPEQSVYYNATENNVTDYEKVLAKAQTAVGEKTNQETLDQLRKDLTQAWKALDGKATDLTKLSAELDAYQPLVASVAYYNATKEKKNLYDTAYRMGQLVIAKENVTQKEVDAQLQQLQQAQRALDGKETDMTALNQLVQKDENWKKTAANYLFASKVKQDNYEQALAKAQALLKNPQASQEEVNQALAQLEKAIKELDGRAGNQAALNDFVANQPAFQATADSYLYATPPSLALYNQALAAARIMLGQALASQEEVDLVFAVLQGAVAQLDGVKPQEVAPDKGHPLSQPADPFIWNLQPQPVRISLSATKPVLSKEEVLLVKVPTSTSVSTENVTGVGKVLHSTKERSLPTTGSQTFGGHVIWFSFFTSCLFLTTNLLSKRAKQSKIDKHL
ncbi:S8 family serine peptidase [Streptococcus sp. 19428wC2_LYSM12]|uniref:S8 family serine peptidase n=1 Tax=unclassified Streptococcus TaxID=2608887 RepID=UPI001071E077|nr:MULTISPECIES: S8 family serine peptidase [unclassified Streptococcus]MBF0788157.1 S8 family serine peptidase [Streptococcus sp. 19428wC2_LYSM12]TFV04794.1 YSIRK-type signal peptide-containing protein [Streptococcus sp. LYSM12]